jgi:PhnB protein
MKLQPNISLAFDGRCEEAFALYERCLGGTLFKMTYAEAPETTAPPGWGAKIYHATLKVGDAAIMGSDVPPGGYETPQGFSIILQMDDPAAAERVFQALAEGGRVGMPLQETFWAVRFASLVDRFGIPWTINCEKPA